MKNKHAFEIDMIKQQLYSLEERMDWKREEIQTMQKEVEQLYQQLKRYKGEAA